MSKKQFKGLFRGALPVRKFNWHLKDIKELDGSHMVIMALAAGGYLTNKDILQFCEDGTIDWALGFNLNEHILGVLVCSWELPTRTLNKMAKEIAEAFLKYEEDMYQKYQERLSDTSWKQLRYKTRVPLMFLKGESLDNYTKVIEEHGFWDSPKQVPKVISMDIIGLDIKVNRDERFVEVATYIKDIERAYEHHRDMEVFLRLIAYDVAKAIREWELNACYQDALRVNGWLMFVIKNMLKEVLAYGKC